MLAPTRIYVKPVLSLLRIPYPVSRIPIKGIAHITGGAFYGKVPRIIPKDKSFIICKDFWPVPEIFKIIQKKGNVDEKEMYSCFNMGIGMVLAVDKVFVDAAIRKLSGFGLRSWVIGEVTKGKGNIKLV